MAAWRLDLPDLDVVRKLWEGDHQRLSLLLPYPAAPAAPQQPCDDQILQQTWQAAALNCHTPHTCITSDVMSARSNALHPNNSAEGYFWEVISMKPSDHIQHTIVHEFLQEASGICERCPKGGMQARRKAASRCL